MVLYSLILSIYLFTLLLFTSRNFYRTESSILGFNLLIQALPALFVSLWLGEERSSYPTILALIGFFVVLSVFRLSPLISTRTIITGHVDQLLINAKRLMYVGLILKFFAIVINAGGIVGYINNLNSYDLNVKSVGFLDVGLDFFILGASVYFVFASIRPSKKLFFLVFVFIALFFLSTSKASILGFIFTAFYFYRISPPTKPKITLINHLGISAFFLLLMISIGIKTQIKYLGIDAVDFDFVRLFELAVNTIAVRYSGEGLFTGYQNIVDRISSDDSLALHGRAIFSAFTQNIPAFLYDNPENKVHPFRGLGYLINSNQVIDLDSNDAPTIFGYCFIDFGIYGYFYVLFFGSLIYVLLARSLFLIKNIPFALTLTFFSTKFISNLTESGFLNIFYWFILSLFLLLVLVLLNLIPVVDIKVRRKLFFS